MQPSGLVISVFGIRPTSYMWVCIVIYDKHYVLNLSKLVKNKPVSAIFSNTA